MSLARLSFHTLRFVLAILCASLVILAYLNYAFQDRPYMALTLALGSAVGYWFTLARRLSGEGAGFGVQRAVRVLVQAFASLLAASGIAVALSMDPASGLCLLAVGACVYFVAAHSGDLLGESPTPTLHLPVDDGIAFEAPLHRDLWAESDPSWTTDHADPIFDFYNPVCPSVNAHED